MGQLTHGKMTEPGVCSPGFGFQPLLSPTISKMGVKNHSDRQASLLGVSSSTTTLRLKMHSAWVSDFMIVPKRSFHAIEW